MSIPPWAIVGGIVFGEDILRMLGIGRECEASELYDPAANHCVRKDYSRTGKTVSTLAGETREGYFGGQPDDPGLKKDILVSSKELRRYQAVGYFRHYTGYTTDRDFDRDTGAGVGYDGYRGLMDSCRAGQTGNVTYPSSGLGEECRGGGWAKNADGTSAETFVPVAWAAARKAAQARGTDDDSIQRASAVWYWEHHTWNRNTGTIWRDGVAQRHIDDDFGATFWDGLGRSFETAGKTVVDVAKGATKIVLPAGLGFLAGGPVGAVLGAVQAAGTGIVDTVVQGVFGKVQGAVNTGTGTAVGGVKSVGDSINDFLKGILG